jgi:hypothetical protein
MPNNTPNNKENISPQGQPAQTPITDPQERQERDDNLSIDRMMARHDARVDPNEGGALADISEFSNGASTSSFCLVRPRNEFLNC